ncbi:putative phosphatidylglycerol/phosphatidylinositol transfer protein DDB_G0282179 [Cajanus cajan]|uniref:Phosphatidylglycerol/phosphatidylinositol transfer protein n=1 Tax=Cajanus cajan TaxID=3821 RepID=A0A151TVM6_CAJCA|nr:putative phosphatidylglycerol/phosphatidylinositol transfer protein DDB_G0282179 [Cajanus cajan]KYP71034.1 Phosphatidylglycerol/phosphatidylinositol transfer protein [Cajanus cajan]
MAARSASTLFFLLCLSISSITFLLSSVHAQAQSHTFNYCDGNADYDVKVSGVEILPDPVERGVPFTFKIPAYTPEPIQSGDLVYEISYAGIEGAPATFLHDLCEEAHCPVPAGNFVLVHTELLPPVTPPGTYNVKLTFKDHKEKLLTCIVFPFKIGAKSSVSAI